MAGFRKAVFQQAAIKMSMYGAAGSGKTFTALLFAEGLAKRSGKRIAYVDTENGTAFYGVRVEERQTHPEAFDFDALYTRSLTEVLSAAKVLSADEYSVVVVDSISHLWDAAIAAYSGPRSAGGSIPPKAWDRIKKPYKELMKFLVDSPFHVFILGREASAFEGNDDGDLVAAGFKMRAEKETSYEPHICMRMVPQKTAKKGGKVVALKEHIITAVAEKDRSGILQGKAFEWPDFDSVIKPVLGILGSEQGATPSDEEAAGVDAEALERQANAKQIRSVQLKEEWIARFALCKSPEELQGEGKRLTPAIKKDMMAEDLSSVRTAYSHREATLKGIQLGGGNLEAD